MVAFNNVEHSKKRQTLDRTYCSIIVHLRPVVEVGWFKVEESRGEES